MLAGRSSLAILTATALTAGTLALDSPAAAAAAPIDWEPCEAASDADCGTVEVPLEWGNPDGGEISIALARREASGERLGTILVNPGGPGGSGVDMVLSGPWITERLHENYDVVGFDPRGVGSSSAIACDADVVDRYSRMTAPSDEEEFDRWRRAGAELWEDCRRRTGPLFDNVDTMQVARDMEAVRASLGEGPLNYLGLSYGSLMGQQYAELYPQNVGAMVLDGNMDHSVDTVERFAADETRAVEELFGEFAAWCGEDAECALHGEDVTAVYGRLREAALRNELLASTGEPKGFDWFNTMTFANLIDPGQWSFLAETLRLLEEGETPAESVSADRERGGESNFVSQAVWCQDWGFTTETFAEFRALRDDLAERFPTMQWTPYNSYSLICQGYTGETTNPPRPTSTRAGANILMVGTRFDHATVYPWNVSAADQNGAALVTYEGYGHTVYSQGSGCVDDYVDAFFRNLRRPPGGASCPVVDGLGRTESGPDPAPEPFPRWNG
ncbi:alpha/beta hydrolase [Salininema proteolyticum]|uniref:Alpha/beta hydrolase n=1 Tax=Salininema proteolyticum TaxID=1607685 RepID=A0ABV8TV20_9ACTN